MNAIGIIVSAELGEQWRLWLNALSQADLEIELIQSGSLESRIARGIDCKTVILDAQLAELSKTVIYFQALRPALQISVVSEIESFSLYYEAMQLRGIHYIAGAMSPQTFVQEIQRHVSRPSLDIESQD